MHERLGPSVSAFGHRKVGGTAWATEQAAYLPLGIDERLTFGVDALYDTKLGLNDATPDTKSLTGIQCLLQALQPYRALGAEALGFRDIF